MRPKPSNLQVLLLALVVLTVVLVIAVLDQRRREQAVDAADPGSRGGRGTAFFFGGFLLGGGVGAFDANAGFGVLAEEGGECVCGRRGNGREMRGERQYNCRNAQNPAILVDLLRSRREGEGRRKSSRDAPSNETSSSSSFPPFSSFLFCPTAVFASPIKWRKRSRRFLLPCRARSGWVMSFQSISDS